LGAEIALYGGPDWSCTYNTQGWGKDDGYFGPEFKRDNVRGSPVVPGSATKIYTEGESFLYTVTILKGHYTAGVLEGHEFTPGKFFSYPLVVYLYE